SEICWLGYHLRPGRIGSLGDQKKQVRQKCFPALARVDVWRRSDGSLPDYKSCFLQTAPAKPSKPTPSKLRVPGSGTEGGVPPPPPLPMVSVTVQLPGLSSVHARPAENVMLSSRELQQFPTVSISAAPLVSSSTIHQSPTSDPETFS